MPKSKTFSETLISWRRKMNLSRVQACEMFAVPYRTWQDWELENRTPPLFTQSAILALLKSK